MTPLEILKYDAAHHYDDVNYDEALAAYHEAENDPNVRMLYYGNSLLFIHDTGEFHFVNADRFSEFVHNVVMLLGMAKEMGFTTIFTDFTNPRIIEVAKQAGVDFSVESYPDYYIMIVRL